MMKNKTNGSAPDSVAACQNGEEPKKKQSIRKYLLSAGFLLVLMAVTFYVIFRDTSINQIWDLLKTIKLYWAAGGLLCMLGFILFQGLVIGLSAQCLRIRLSPWEMLQYSFVSFFYSGITPSAIGGQPMQFYHMCRDKMSPSTATLVLFITNMAYQFVIVVLGLFMFFTKLHYVIRVNRTIIILFFLGLSVNLFILLILFGVMFSENLLRKILRGAVSFLSRIKLIKNSEKVLCTVDVYLDDYKAGIALIKNNSKRFVLILLSTAAHFLLYHLIPFFVFKSFGLKGDSFFDLLAISAILYVAINMFPLPGSVGAAEGGFVMLFGPLFGKAIMPAMLLSRFINFYTMLLVSGGFSAFAQLRKPYDLTRDSRRNKSAAE